MPDDALGRLGGDRGNPGPPGRARGGDLAPGGRTVGDGPRARTAVERLLRLALGASLAALAVAAVDAPHQRSPLAVLLPAGACFALALARPGLAIVGAAALVPLLPVTGNLLSGPWVAPAEVLLLLLAAALLVRPGRAPGSPLGTALAVSVSAVGVGAAAATLAALAPGELPAAVGDLARSLFSPGLDHAALPLRTALVHAAGLLGFLSFRRAAAERGPEPLLSALVAGLAGVGLFAVVEASTGLKLWPAALYELLSRGMRVPSTLPDYNATGAALALGLFPAIALARGARGRARLGWGTAAVLLLAGLLLCGSRGAWLATAVALGAALWGAFGARRQDGPGEARRLLLGAVAAVGLFALGVAVWPGEVGQLLRSRAATLVHPAEAIRSVQAGRLGFWVAGVRMIEAHPLSGVGPGRVPSRFAEFRDDGFPVDVENLHDYFLQAVAENGVPGGLLVLAPFVPLALLVVRALASGAALSSPLLSLGPSLLAFALTGLGAHPWLLPELQLLFWGASALLSAALEARGPSEPTSRHPWLPWALLLAWALPRLAFSPGSERGRFGYAEWGGRPAQGRFFWTGPLALVPVSLPGGAQRFVVRLRTMLPDVETHPVRAAVRLDGGPWSHVQLVDQEWQDVAVERGPYRRTGKAGAGAGPPGLLGLQAGRGFCPARDGGGDRRLLALQLARPPLRSGEGSLP